MTKISITSWPRAIVVCIIVAYCMVLLISPQPWYPEFVRSAAAESQQATSRFIRRAFSVVGLRPRAEWATGAYFLLIAGVVPLLAARIVGRTPRDVGWRWPNSFGIRYFLLALIVSLPFLVWMVQSPSMAGLYLKQLERTGAFTFCTFYLVNMFTEHLMLHGVVLGLTSPAGRWPEVDTVSANGTGLIRFLRGLGFSGAGKNKDDLSSWLGLPEGYLLPILLSALLFGGVHLGKDSRELVLSFPGGLAQAYIAIRSGSWFTPFGIHLATASIALGMMLWFR